MRDSNQRIFGRTLVKTKYSEKERKNITRMQMEKIHFTGKRT